MLGHDVGRAATWSPPPRPRRAGPRRPAGRPPRRPPRPGASSSAGDGLTWPTATWSSPSLAQRRPRASRGFGQQADRAACPSYGPARRARPAHGRSPRSAAARSSTRSRTAADERAGRCRPWRRGRTAARARRAVAHGLGVEVVDDLHVVGDEADRAPARPPGTAARREPLEVVVDVGLQPRLARRPGAAAVDQVPVAVECRSPPRPRGDLGGDVAVLADVGAAGRAATSRPSRSGSSG